MTLREKIIGMILGVGIGDALGAPVETFTPEEIQKLGGVKGYMDGPPQNKWHANLPAGTTTDDTQLTLAVARAIINSGGTVDMDEIAKQHVQALETTGLGWGPSTREAVERIASGMSWRESGKTDSQKPRGLGNGVVMKAAPIAAFWNKQLLSAREGVQVVTPLSEIVRDFTYMTHASPVALAPCLAHVFGLVYLLQEEGRCEAESLIGSTFMGISLAKRHVNPDSEYERLVRGLSLASEGHPPDVFGKEAFAVSITMPQAYAYFVRNPHSIDSLYETVNAGGDADSTGAMVGSMLGALNGPDIFPRELVLGLIDHKDIWGTAEELCASLGI